MDDSVDKKDTEINSKRVPARSNSSGRKSRRSSKSPRVLIALLVLVVTIGCLQIYIYHPDLSTEEHWFDHDVWKVAIQSNATAIVEAPSRDNDTVPVSSRTRNPVQVLLDEAGFRNVSDEELSKLPSWQTLTGLYGDLKEPIIIGMDTCEDYRNKVPLRQRYTAVAGLFNTGTNAMEYNLQHNVNAPSAWQVPWGKHRMEFVRLNHTAPGAENRVKAHVLPVVMIRDPFHWMQSMCHEPYATHWHKRPQHCPNLVPDELDRQRFHDLSANLTDAESAFPVHVIFDKQQIFYWKSLVDLWNDWYRRYLRAKYPRLMVRFEDMVFHGPAMMKKIAECAGVDVPEEFSYQTKSSKSHGSGTTFLKAIVKTGDVQNRVKRMSLDDLQFAAAHLDKELLDVFQYKLPPLNVTYTDA